MRVRLEVSGERELQERLGRMGRAGQDVGLKVLGDAMREILPAVKADTPVDPEDGGQLEESVRLTKPTRTRSGGVSAGIVAGGAPLVRFLGARRANVYAVIQHEDLTLKHTKGKGKFIEVHVNRIAVQIPDRFLAALDQEVGG